MSHPLSFIGALTMGANLIYGVQATWFIASALFFIAARLQP